MPDRRTTGDTIAAIQRSEKDLKSHASIRGPFDEEVIGLTFKPGDIVYDRYTGEKARVLLGKHATLTIPPTRGEGT